MTPDQYKRKRRDLVRQRTKYKGNVPITNRITIMINLLKEFMEAPNKAREETVEKAILRTAKELDDLMLRRS